MENKNKKSVGSGKVMQKQVNPQQKARSNSNSDLGAILSQTRFKPIGPTGASKRTPSSGPQRNAAKVHTSDQKTVQRSVGPAKTVQRSAIRSSPNTVLKSSSESTTNLAKPTKNLPKVQDVDDDDSDIEVEEINIISKPNVGQDGTGNVVIVGIMKQVEELEKTLKSNIATKEAELKQERKTVDQLKKINEMLELRDNKRKESLEKLSQESSKQIEEKNSQIESLQTFSRKNNDLMAKKFSQKQEEINVLQENLKKVLKDLKSLQNWKECQIEKEKGNLKKLVQASAEKESHYNQIVKDLHLKIKEKDEKINNVEKNNDALQKKIADKDNIAKEMKHKVGSLVAEFTKAIKERDEKLDNKKKEALENSGKIDQLSTDKANLQKEIVLKDAEMKSISLQNAKQAKLLKDKSKKIELISTQIANREQLHQITMKQLQDKNCQIKRQNENKNAHIKKLQNQLVKIKTMKVNEVAMCDEDLFEDKLEKSMYESLRIGKVAKPLMLTYVLPVLKVEVDPNFLQSQTKEEDSEEKPLKQFHIQEKPLMVTYLWPMQTLQSKVKTNSVVCKGTKRTLSQDDFQNKRMRVSEPVDLDQHKVSLKRKCDWEPEIETANKKIKEDTFTSSILDELLEQVTGDIQTPNSVIKMVGSVIEETIDDISDEEKDLGENLVANAEIISSPEQNLVKSVLCHNKENSSQSEVSKRIPFEDSLEIVSPLVDDLFDYVISFIEVKNMLC